MTALGSSLGHGHASLVQPILFCGPGSNLYPLCSTVSTLSPLEMEGDSPVLATKDLPKAMLPILNRPMLAYPLQQLLSAGLRHAIVFAPSEQHQQLAAALKSLILIPPVLVQSGKKLTSTSVAAAAAAVEEASRNPNISVSVGLSSTSAQSNSTAYMSANDFSVSSLQNETVMRVDLLPLGPEDVAKTESDMTTTKKYKKLGTAGLIAWLSSIGRLDKDPLIIPVDLISQNISLSSVIHGHVANVPEPPALTCLMYERGAGEGTGKEREKDGPPKLFTAYDRTAGPSAKLDPTSASSGSNTFSTHQLLLLQDSDDVSDLDASDLHLRMSLLWSHPHIRISTSLLDSHIYLFNLPKLLGLLRSEAGQKMKSLREEVVPFMVKCSWRTGLREKAGWLPAATPRAASAGSSVPWSSTQLLKEDNSGVHRSTTYVEPELLQAGPSLSRLTFDDPGRGSPLFTPDQSILLSPSSVNGNASKDLSAAEFSEANTVSSDADRQKLRAAARISAAEIRTNAIIVRLTAERKHPIDPSMSIDEYREMEERNGRHAQFIARANTVPTYMECNRHMLRSLVPALGVLAGQGGPLMPGTLAHPLPSQTLSAPFSKAAGLNAAGGVANTPSVDSDAAITSDTSSRATSLINPKAQISPDSLIGDLTRVAERTTVKRSVVGRGCLIGKNVKVTGCIIMDGVSIGDNAKLENCILCPASVVEEKCNLKDCDVAAAVKVTSGTNSKSEKFDE